MKKVIFISALAIAAAVSCTKSDIVDTKFGNDVIGFESYIGRAAQTKATVIDNTNITSETIGLYGFYTGANPWKIDTHASNGEAIADPTPNLWADKYLKYVDNAWTTEGKKYWTNATDYYSFLAYAPKAVEGNGLVATTGANPTVTYTVPTAIGSQKDFLYAEPIFNRQRGTGDAPAAVALTMKHALSRIAIKANENHDDYTYTITGLSIQNGFTQKKTFSLVESEWMNEGAVPETAAYDFVVKAGDVTSTEWVACTGNEYLMVIPVDLTNVAEGKAEDYAKAATLTVKYKTTYVTGNIVSNEIVKTIKVAQNFQKGKAYTINLTFGPNDNEEIKFTVDVDDWRAEGDNAAADSETDVTPKPSNPENGTSVNTTPQA